MDAQQFLAEFGHIVNAPGGVARLREMVLALAVSGRLTERADFKDNPAVDLLGKLKQELSDYKAANRYRRTAGDRDAKNDLIASAPNGWVNARLGQIGVLIRGVSYNKAVARSVNGQRMTGLLRANNIGSNISFNDLVYVPSDLVDKEQVLRAGDVLIAMSSGSKDLVGKAAIVLEDTDFGFGAFCGAFRPMPSLQCEFVRVVMQSPQYRDYVSSQGKGIGINNLTKGHIEDYEFFLPPIEEQSRIVAKVDELMALCDTLEAQQQARRKLQNNLRQSILQAVANSQSPLELQTAWKRLADNFGELFHAPEDVADLRKLLSELAIRGALDALDEPSDTTVVETYLAELAGKKSGKRFAKIIHIEEDIPLPNGWRWVLLEDLLADSESGWSPKCDSEPRRSGEWGVLKVSAVTWGVFNPEENKRLPLSLEARTECEVKPGDFMLSRANTAELVARSVIAPASCPEKLLMSDKIVRLAFLDERLKRWINLVNNSELARSYYKARATGTSDSMRNVSRQVIHELPIPLPSLQVQERVLKALDRLMTFCDDLEQQALSRMKLSSQLSITAVSSLTGITTEQEEEPMKAPLATILACHNGEMSEKRN